ncbi:hypothetical protein [Neptunicoccus cionae]|nr:hypothetical protein [Amylibacter cionae]
MLEYRRDKFAKTYAACNGANVRIRRGNNPFHFGSAYTRSAA